MDQREYTENLQPADVPRARRALRDAPLTDPERTLLRVKAGELNWLQAISRPDLAGAVTLLQTSFGEPKVAHLMEANRLIREAKNNPVQLRIRPLEIQNLMFICSADAAWANCPDLSSNMGYFIFAADNKIDKEQMAEISPIAWKSHKQRRRAASTLAAEALATGEGVGALDWFRVFWEWLVVPDFRLAEWEGIQGRPALVLTDCKSVFDSLQQLWSSNAKSDKRTSIDLALIRESLSRDYSRIRWIDTRVQLADSMTKGSASPAFLRKTLLDGMYRIVAEGVALERRETQKREKGLPRG